MISLAWALFKLRWRRLWCRHTSTQTHLPQFAALQALFSGELSPEEYREQVYEPFSITTCMRCGMEWRG